MISKQIKVLFAAACLSLAGWGSAGADTSTEPRVVTGTQWQGSSEQQKRAFLMGAYTVIGLEKVVQGSTNDNSAIPVLERGLKGLTVTEVMERLNGYYAGNPDRLSEPVIKVIYFELAKPRAEAK
jgi:hypothetical protein